MDLTATGRNISLLVAVLTLSIASAMFYSFSAGRNIAKHYAPLVDAAMEIKLEATTAHLWFEEVISGDKTVDINVVWGHIDQAEWYAQAMLEGGENNEGTFISLDNRDLRQKVEQTIAGINAFRVVAHERWNSQSQSGIGSDIEQRFDKIFSEFIIAADNVETAIQDTMARQLRQYNIEQVLLIIIILILGLFTAIVLNRYDRRRSSDMLALHDREQNLRITLNSIGDAVIVTDSNGNITHLNPVAENLTGWKLSQARRKPLTQVFHIVHAHTRETVVNPVKRVIETGKITGLANHTVLISKNGNEYQITDSGAPIRTAEGVITGVVLVFRDVTEENDLQESLESSQLFMAMVLHTIPDLIWLKDLNGIYLGCNQQFERFFGAKESEIIGKTDYDFVDKELADFFREKDKAVMEADKTIKNEESITFADDGHTELVETIKTPMFNSNGKIIGILGVSRDITERKQSDEILERYKTIFEEAPLGVALIDSLTGHIYEVNKKFAEIAGRSKDDMVTIDWMSITHPDDVQEDLDNMALLNAGKIDGFNMQKRYQHPDGSYVWIDMTIAPVSVENKSEPRHLCMIQDITERKKTAQRLSESELRFQNLLQNIPSVSVQGYKLDGTTIYWNKASEHLYGYTEEQAIGQNLLDLIIPKDMVNNVKVGMQSMAETGQAIPASELLLKRQDGSLIPVYSSHAIVQSEGRPSELFCIDIDLTERKQAEASLQLSSRVFSDTHEGITITDANKKIIDVNPAFCDITGYSREEVMGQDPNMLSSGKQGPEFYTDMWQEIDERGHWQGEVWNRKKDGELYAELLTISSLTDDNKIVTHYVGVFSDITQSKRQQEKLNLMAHYDVLTGLPNRALFTDRFHQAIAHSKRTESQLAVCFLDLDNFKPINDNYGHEIGDQLLVEVANRISFNIREEDTVSRQGGDEFAVLLSDLDSYAQCEQTLERIHHALAQPYLIDDIAHTVTASSGVTLYPSDEGDIDTLLRHADQAMYQAKLAGKHRYQLFNPQHDQQIVQKHHRLSEIEQALIQNEFHLYYQPKVNMRTGDVFGAEALIRWIHPEQGLIPPLDFLPIIEGTELEVKIGDWVIEQALIQLEDWQQQGITLEVSVNIASHHLQSESFFSKLDAILERHSTVDSKCLQLEILESSALSDLHTISNIIKTCQDTLGVNIALDDFGTGYSSLTHLRSLSANTIKIDRSFVRDMLDDPSDYAIIDGVIGLAGSFNRTVIAEGVETTAHGLMLLIMGCELAQGYGIARPMPADELPEWLTTYTPNREWQRCGNKHLTAKENKVKLFRLVSEHWQNHFVSAVQSEPESVEYWPIMGGKYCHCGYWLKRAQQEQLFDPKCLDKLGKAHEKIHIVAHSLLIKYQAGELDTARNGLGELQKAFDEMNNVLDYCE